MNIINGIINLFRFDKTNWKAVVLCLIAATVFWFFNALNKVHTATLSFPIKFKYNESLYIPVKNLPERVLLNITGIGWDLLRKSVGFKVVPLLITLDRPSELKKLPPGSLLALATAQFDQLKINHVVSDTLMVSIDRRKTKKVKLFVTKTQFHLAENYGISSVVHITPDSILIGGPSSVLNQIPDSIPLQIPDKIFDKDVTIEANIILPIKDGIMLNNESAQVKFQVSNFIEQTKKIKIVVFPAPPFRYQLSADSVLVNFRIPNTLKDSLEHANRLFAVVDLQDYEVGITKTIPSIKGSIPFAHIVSIDSVTLKKY